MKPIAAAAIVLCVASAGFCTETYDAGTKTLTVTADSLAARVDPLGEEQDFNAATYAVPAMSKDDFNALPGLRTITFNGCTQQFQSTTTIKAYYDASNYVTFNGFGGSTGYNYGGGTSGGRRAHSGTQDMQQLGTVGGDAAGGPFHGDAATAGSEGLNWFKTTITVSDANKGISAIGFIVDGRDDQSTLDGNIWVTLNDATVVQIPYTPFGGVAGSGLFFGYQAPAGKFITGVECTRRVTSGNSFEALDDLTFVVSDLNAAIPPASITDLAASNPTESSVTLTWTAPGDSGSTGTAASYDIRYSTSAITGANFASAQQVASPPAPAAAGTGQSTTVTGLNAYTTYYFAIKTTSHGGLVSGISNLTSIRTAVPSNDTIPPLAVTNLSASSPSYTTITLNWTAPVDPNSPCTAYDIRYATSTITDANWASAAAVAATPVPHTPGTNQYFVVVGLDTAKTYYFALKTSDAAGNASPLSNVASGTTLASPPAANKTLLKQADFHYKGYYAVPNTGNFAELQWGQGFTHRYVNGQLRFMTLSFYGNVPGGGLQLIEFLPPSALGGTATTVTGHWPDIWAGSPMGSGGSWVGLWYEQAQERLWTTQGVEYPMSQEQEARTATMIARALNSDGTITNLQGPWGLQGILGRRLYGGMQAVPSWFQTTYGTGAYCGGWGGYCSRLSVGPASLGPTFYTYPDPTGYPAGDIPTQDYKTLMDHSSASVGQDWYASGFPTTADRGVRNSDVTNDYETPSWQSPAPDGLGRWVWGDSNWNTGCWIETPTRQGFITVPKFQSGRVWYEMSAGHCERQTAEIQVFDPRILGEVAQGLRTAWNTYPSNRWEITDTCKALGLMWNANTCIGGPAGASYDAITRTLYVYCIWGTNLSSYILVYDVGPKVGDINADSYVNVSDLQLLVAAWGSQKVPSVGSFNPDADLNGDGYVNVGDLQLLVAHWAQ